MFYKRDSDKQVCRMELRDNTTVSEEKERYRFGH